MEQKTETRGGYRPGTGRKLKYGEETVRLVFQVPASKADTLTKMMQKELKKWVVKKDKK